VGPLERLRRLEDARTWLSEADDRIGAVSEERRVLVADGSKVRENKGESPSTSAKKRRSSSR
jgi:hypothetical protein